MAKPLRREDEYASLSRAASSALLDRAQEFHPHDFHWVVDMLQQCLPFTQQGSLPWWCRTSHSMDAHPPSEILRAAAISTGIDDFPVPRSHSGHVDLRSRLLRPCTKPLDPTREA